MEKQKIVMEIQLHDEEDKRKAMKIVSALTGVDSISMEMKDKKMTVIGDVDPICMVRKLRKFRYTEIVSVGPAKKEEKPEKKDPKAEVTELIKYINNIPPHWVEMPYHEPPSCVIC